MEPFTTYHIGVVAVNSAGKVSSPWTLTKTLESAPSGLMNFTVEQRERGRALLLQWAEPVRTNGVIKVNPTLREEVTPVVFHINRRTLTCHQLTVRKLASQAG